MTEQPDRVEQFKQEIADMNLRDPRSARDRRALQFGVLLMVAAVVVEVFAYVYSSNGNELEQRDAIVLAIAGLVVAVIGGALFIRFSVGQFLRWWLARITYEQQHQTDRIVEAVAEGD